MFYHSTAVTGSLFAATSCYHPRWMTHWTRSSASASTPASSPPVYWQTRSSPRFSTIMHSLTSALSTADAEYVILYSNAWIKIWTNVRSWVNRQPASTGRLILSRILVEEIRDAAIRLDLQDLVRRLYDRTMACVAALVFDNEQATAQS